MQANQRTLTGVMKSAERFVIPEYQRPYCWTEEEVEQLWNDLSEAYEDSKNSNSAAGGADDYFLGPVVVAKRPSPAGEVSAVVDGQQRLTTLHTLLWCARRKLTGSAEQDVEEMRVRLDRLLLTPAGLTSLAVAKEDQANFLALRESTPVDETRPLGLTGTFLRKHIAAFVPADLIEFLNFTLNQTTFILVETESYATAWDLFIGLNGKGRPLNPADLIKAFVCGTSTDSAAMSDIWKDKVLPLGGDATSALLEITRVATGDVGSEAKLFKLFEKAWNGKLIRDTLVSDGSMVYERFWQTPLNQVAGLEGGRRFLRGLRALERRDHTSLLLALAARFGAEFVFKTELLQCLEAYQLWMAIRGKRGKERDFTALAWSIYSSPIDEAQALARVKAQLTRIAPPADDVRAFIRGAAYPGRIMKFIVNQYEEGMRGDVQVGDVQFEHMMPKTPTAYWYEKAGTHNDNEYARIVNNIGNIVPLDYLTNIAGSNDDWPTKCALYRQHVPNWLVAGIANENPDGWTPPKIQNRATAIAEWAVTERWNLTQALQGL
jgi:hypothetical protein